MKNKVDINKLIEKKYKGNTLELSDILEQIDLVLNESFYASKLTNPGDKQFENEESIKISQRMYGTQGTRDEVSGDLGRNPQYNRQVTAANIAETNSNLPTIQGIQEMPVFDLFSMITNSKMELDNDDRKLLNDILENAGATPSSSWKDRVQLLQNYAYLLGNPRTVDKLNIREGISNLIFINLLKKLSYFTDQPSKQFEYVMAPLISPDAQVIKGDGDISDVRTTTGEQFSIKFFTASSPDVKGSITRLKTHPNGLNYVFGKVFSGGMLEFGECMITAYIRNINPQEYKHIHTISSGMVEIYEAISNSQVPKVKIYIRTTDNEEEVKDYSKIKRRFQVGEKPKTATQTFQHTSATLGRAEKQKLDRMRREIKSLFGTFSANEKQKKPLNNNQFNSFMGLAEEYAQMNSEFSKMFEVFKKIPNIEKNYDAQTKFHNELNNSFEIYLRQVVSQQKSQTQSQQPEQNTSLSEQTQEKEEPQFNFRLSGGAWELMSVSSLNLGSPSVYNNQLVFFSDSISKTFKNVMDNFQKLNKNLVSYFATSTEKQKQNNQGKSSAQDCVDNAEQIIYGVTDIAGSEGEKVNVINPRLVRRSSKS
jgi:hypothetical protein